MALLVGVAKSGSRSRVRVVKVCFIDRDDVFDIPDGNLRIEQSHVTEPFPVRVVKGGPFDMCRMESLRHAIQRDL